jgi:hypothetical protein
MVDLWPADIAYTRQKAPVTILKEQAVLLGDKTQNIVTASVEAIPPGLLRRTPQDIWQTRQDTFAYQFSLVAPALSHYRYQLFSIVHDASMYPVMFRFDDEIKREYREFAIATARLDDPDCQAETEEQFLETLKFIFQTSKTRQVIQAILAQSQEMPE